MKRKLQRILVGLSLLVILPGALLGLLILIGGIGSGFQQGFSATDLIAFPLLILPSFMGWWGVKLVFRLYGRFSNRLRKETLFYHGLTLCYCSMWLVSTACRDGGSFPIFELQERVVGICLLSVPLLIVCAPTLMRSINDNVPTILNDFACSGDEHLASAYSR